MAIENTLYLQRTVCCPQGEPLSQEDVIRLIGAAIYPKYLEVMEHRLMGNEQGYTQIARIAYETMAPYFAPPF